MAPQPSSRFRHGVASFEPTATSVLIWTRVIGADSLEWSAALDPGHRQVVAEGRARADSSRDWTAVADVTGLTPSTSYWYRFRAGDETSPVGRTRTLPAGRTERLVLGLACCARFASAPLGVYRALAERELDLVVHLGDYIYEDDGHKGPRHHVPPYKAVTLDDYRQRLAQMREDPDCQALHRRHPMIGIWDDHDLSDNAWRDGSKAHDPRRDGPWDERVAAAARARQEWLPARLADPEQPTRTWRSVALGDLAELILPDTRLVGRDRQAADKGAKSLDDPERSLLGDEQRTWLRSRVLDTSRPWALLTSGVVINRITLPLPAPGLVNTALPSGYSVVGGQLLHDDQWDGYPVERDRLTGWLRERAVTGARTVLLSGDVHSSWAFEGPLDDDGSPVAVEFTIPAVASEPMGRTRVPGGWRLFDAVASRLDQVRWSDVTERGYGLLDVTPEAVRVAWWFVDSFAADPSRGQWLGAAFLHRRGDWPPRLEETPGWDPGLQRPDLAGAAPTRPRDLEGLRRRRTAQRLVRWTGLLAATAVVAVVVARRPGRRARRTIPSLRRSRHG